MAATGAKDANLHSLPYTVYHWSSFYSHFYPENIVTDDPEDETSRWTPESIDSPQYLTLKLVRPSVIHAISFGKYQKPHVCNLHTFQVFGGLDEDHMNELCSGGLCNNKYRDKFNLKTAFDGKPLVCNFIKIVPLLAWEKSFRFSIWHVDLQGQDSPMVVEGILRSLRELKSNETTRLCLKHLRKLGHMDLFSELRERSRVKFEHPKLTELHQNLVQCGNFDSCEQIIEDAAESGQFDEFLKHNKIGVEWESISVSSGQDSWPGMRGGHQMVFDPVNQIVVMFGGWDGVKDLGDFWQYDINVRCWECLSMNTENQGGPSPRSCHKMCIDWRHRKVYTMGRYVEKNKALALSSVNEISSDFFCYDLSSHKWQLLSNDTAKDGGPGLVYDHQMCMDSEEETIYVFGGQPIFPSQQIGGLYSYHVPTATWTRQREKAFEKAYGDHKLSGLYGMVFNENSRQLFFISRYHRVTKFLTYQVDIHQIEEFSIEDEMNVGTTQRVTINSDLNEIYVFKGHHRRHYDSVRNSLWLFSISTRKWICLYKNGPESKEDEPCPRYAHQLVYNPLSKTHFLFGGNAGKDHEERLTRLDDFWALQLVRPSADNLVRHCKYLIRKQRFEELSLVSSVDALLYLQTELSSVVDHQKKSESEEFCSLVSVLIANVSRQQHESDSDQLAVEIRLQRNKLFEELSAHFPRSMTQPGGNEENVLLHRK